MTHPDLTREPDGRFGAQPQSAPEVAFSPVAANGVRTVSAVLPVTHTRRTLFGREKTVTEQAKIDVTFRTMAAESTIPGERSERIVDGQAHLPVTEDGARVQATDETMLKLVGALARNTTTGGTTHQDARDDLSSKLRELASSALVIDGELWVRASLARKTR